jgi:3D (Asp-Asp-Asp) domain-containing protein
LAKAELPDRVAQKQAFSSRTLGVRVDVLVTDGRNPVTGLTAADFELRDNGVAQTINLVDTSVIPINAVLALDTSASTAGQRQKILVAAGEALLDGLKTTIVRRPHDVQSSLAVPGLGPRIRGGARVRASGRSRQRSWTASMSRDGHAGQTGRSLVSSA